MHIKQEFHMDDQPDDYPSRHSSSEPSIPYSVTNENWRGKNDPAERRRIQNRINQRNFRERQRAGQSSKQYKPRSTSGASSSRQEEAQTPPENADVTEPSNYEGQPSSNPPTSQPSGSADPSTGRQWDELGQLINRNFMQAAYSNARLLGIDARAVQSGTSMLTPRHGGAGTLGALQPIKLQYEAAHDPIIDIIPHPRLRFNILRAIAMQQLDAAAFSGSLRSSGVLESVQQQWQRGGLVVWSSPEQIASWELSELFVRRWAFLLAGCEDLLAATNSWRSRRGERLFPTTLGERQS